MSLRIKSTGTNSVKLISVGVNPQLQIYRDRFNETHGTTTYNISSVGLEVKDRGCFASLIIGWTLNQVSTDLDIIRGFQVDVIKVCHIILSGERNLLEFQIQMLAITLYDSQIQAIYAIIVNLLFREKCWGSSKDRPNRIGIATERLNQKW